jgi:hypothetical protein
MTDIGSDAVRAKSFNVIARREAPKQSSMADIENDSGLLRCARNDDVVLAARAGFRRCTPA